MTTLALLLFTFPALVFPLASEYNMKPGKNVELDFEMLFMTLCAGATNPSECIPQHFSNYSRLRTFTADCSDTILKGECRATVVFSIKELTLGIFFKGPSGISTFKSSAASTISAQTLVDFNGLGRVGDQFLITFNRLWNVQGLGTYVQELWDQYCDVTLMIGGHSVASCNAQMAAVTIRNADMWRKRSIVYYGYGTPRCGDEEFAALMDESAYHRYRINWLTDNIPQYPPTTCNRYVKPKRGSGTDCWFHCCFAINYKQWAFGGLLNEVETCDNPETPSCNTGTSPAGHTAYYETSQGDYDGLTCGWFKKFTVAS